MNKKNASKHFPLYKYVYEEYVYGRDSGTEYSDPENDIRKGGGLNYFKKDCVDSEWVKIYSEGCGSFEYAGFQSTSTIAKLINSIEPTDDACMFLCGDTMFSFDHYIKSQRCVCGIAIDDNYYNDYEDDNTIKADLLNSFVTFYKTDELAIQNGRVYLNGELKMTKDQIKKAGFQYHQLTAMFPNEVKEKIKKLFPEAKEYSSWSGWGIL